MNTTTLYIDTEFNSFKGALISMALVSDDGKAFYSVLECPNPDPWVEEHVMWVLNQAPVSKPQFQAELQAYLAQFPAIHVVADWPEDIQHFCESLITGPGTRIDTPLLTMEIRRDLDSSGSKLAHNALADAYAIREMAQK
jgi:hypothetical protein